jgi:sugar lactone lactonase YvrE/enterochelin esterase-like enzyme
MPYRAPLLSLLILITGSTLRAQEPDYPLGPDSQPHDSAPRGTVTKHSWADSKIFPGTTRDYWVYVPAQYDPSKPACVMVFQDGGGFQDLKGGYRVPVVFDNLIHKKEMPATIGVFVNPGVIPAPRSDAHPRYNRSFEYDTPSDQYARFLLEEILPAVAKDYNLTTEATGRAICGASSGGIAAFTAAWERPDAFTRVVSFVGSFTDLRGGNDYPSLVRRTEPKPIRVFLQDGRNDLDIYAGSWWVANNDLAAAMKFAGYEHEFVQGEGGHNGKHGGAILPDALRYIWKDYPKLPAMGTFPHAAKDGRPTVMDIVTHAEPWQVVSEGHQFTEGPAADGKGNLYFTDIPNNRIHKVDESGKVTLFAESTGGANGLSFGPDGRLYACQGKAKRVAAYDVGTGREETVADGIEANDLAITHDGRMYITEPNARRVWLVTPDKRKRVVDFGIARPNGVVLTPDQSQLAVADTSGHNVYLFRIEPDGKLSLKQPYFTCRLPDWIAESGADGMTVDAQGRLYVTTKAGLQVFDQAGKCNAILPKPQNAWLSNACFGGKGLDTLYVTCGDKVFKRKTKTKGVLSWQAPVLPPAPRL